MASSCPEPSHNVYIEQQQQSEWHWCDKFIELHGKIIKNVTVVLGPTVGSMLKSHPR